MPARFYVPGLSGPTDAVRLPDDEARHLVRVLRLEVGADVAIFDGRGREYLARVLSVEGGVVLVQPHAPLDSAPEPTVSLAVAHALLKGRKLDDVVRDLTMVGVDLIQPLRTERVESRSRDVTRWERIAVASAKQCRRAVVPRIPPPRTLSEYLGEVEDDLGLLLVEPTAADGGQETLSQLAARPRPSRATLMVGPEGGWSPGEVAAARAAGFRPITLGRRTWRADAAALCAIGVLQYVWGDFG